MTWISCVGYCCAEAGADATPEIRAAARSPKDNFLILSSPFASSPAGSLEFLSITLALRLELRDANVLDPILDILKKAGLTFVRCADPWVAAEIGQELRRFRHRVDFGKPFV